ncbi:DNA-binding protein [Mycobacterium sp. ML4]
MATDELDQLLLDRFNLHRSDLIAALKALPAHRPWAATLTADEARLLDDAGFTEDPEAYAEIAADVTAHMARLYSTAYTAAEVREGLGVNDSRVRQRRLAHTLWAINDGGTWVYPAIQFETVDRGHDKPAKLKQVRGLDELLPALLARELHPTAVSGFLMTPQPDLRIDGQPKSVREWLLHGESVEPVLGLIEIGEWAAT